MISKTTLITSMFFMLFFFQNHFFEIEEFSEQISKESKQIRTPMQEKQDTLDIHQYGKKIANLLLKSDWQGVLHEIHPVHLPKNWKEMIKPSFESYFGYQMSVEVIPIEELPDYQLKWIYKAPEEILKKTKWAIRLRYDNTTESETDKGKLELAVYEDGGGGFSILLVGGKE